VDKLKNACLTGIRIVMHESVLSISPRKPRVFNKKKDLLTQSTI